MGEAGGDERVGFGADSEQDGEQSQDHDGQGAAAR